MKTKWPQRRIWLAAVLAVLTTVALTSIVRAHANLLRSDPADGAILAEPPGEVRLWFDEPISSEFSTAQLFDTNSQPIEIASIRTDSADPTLLILTLPELPPGVYSVLWKILSETDGHFSQGLLVFGVGEGVDLGTAAVTQTEAAAPPTPEVVLRWLNFTLLAGLVGAIGVLQLVLVPARYTLEAGSPTTVSLGTAQRRVLGWASWCAGLAWLVGIGLLLWQTASLLETLPEDVSFQNVGWQILSRTRWGTLWLARQGILLALAGAVLLHRAAAPPPPRPNMARAPLLLLAGLLSLVLITLQALSGHASGVNPNVALAIVADVLHLLAASLWVGGLLALAIGLLPLLRRSGGDFAALARAGWRPFSQVAALSVGLLLATGLYNTARQVASVDALLTTLYGRALLGKVGLMLAVGLFGLLNSTLLHPHLAAPLARLLGRPSGWTPLALRRLPTLVLAEAGLALLVLLVTGLVTAAPAPRGPEFTVVPEEVPGALSQSVDDVVVTLSAKPNRPGQNVFTVFARSTRRPPPAEIGRVVIRFTYLDQDSGRVSATAEEVEPGRFMLAGNYLSLAGPWQIDVVVRRQGLEDRVARFDWLVAPPGESRPVVVSKHPLESLLTMAAAGIILVVLLVVVGVRLVRNQSRYRLHAHKQTHSPGYWFELPER